MEIDIKAVKLFDQQTNFDKDIQVMLKFDPQELCVLLKSNPTYGLLTLSLTVEDYNLICKKLNNYKGPSKKHS